MSSVPVFLKAYPKARPRLPDAIAAIYETHYQSNRSGGTTASSLAQRMEAWMHRQVAADARVGLPASTLEIGAGTLNQLRHEHSAGPYDIVEPFSKLYENSPDLDRIRAIYPDIADVPEDIRYARITSVATLEHICDLPFVLARSGCLLENGGSFRAAIPSEGTPLWTLGWKLTTGLEFKLKHGLDYGELMRHEHVNSAREIRDILGWFFSSIRSRSFGPSQGLSLYQFHECQSPRIDRCKAFLANRT